jgi:hypothetical protein
MFDLKLIDGFRKESEDDAPINDDVKKAWFVFLSDFVTCVSYHWSHYLKEIKVDNVDPSFKGIMTASDEAYTIWLLQNKFEEVNEDAIAIKGSDRETWKKNRPKRNVGRHGSKWKLDDFVDLHVKIKKNRDAKDSNKLWERMFFNQFVHRLTDSEATRDPDSASKYNVNNSNLLDDEDEINDDE